jgi:hypothetical protein
MTGSDKLANLQQCRTNYNNKKVYSTGAKFFSLSLVEQQKMK